MVDVLEQAVKEALRSDDYAANVLVIITQENALQRLSASVVKEIFNAAVDQKGMEEVLSTLLNSSEAIDKISQKHINAVFYTSCNDYADQQEVVSTILSNKAVAKELPQEYVVRAMERYPELVAKMPEAKTKEILANEELSTDRLAEPVNHALDNEDQSRIKEILDSQMVDKIPSEALAKVIIKYPDMVDKIPSEKSQEVLDSVLTQVQEGDAILETPKVLIKLAVKAALDEDKVDLKIATENISKIAGAGVKLEEKLQNHLTQNPERTALAEAKEQKMQTKNHSGLWGLRTVRHKLSNLVASMRRQSVLISQNYSHQKNALLKINVALAQEEGSSSL